MSVAAPRPTLSALTAVSILAYAALCTAASALDLWTTEIALGVPGASEANVFATTAGVYAAAKAWAINAVGVAGMVAMYVFGLRHADEVAPKWLAHPRLSFFTIYVNPWSRRAITRSPLHAVGYAVAFVVLRLAAATNNLIIAAGATGPLGWMVRTVADRTTPVTGFAIAMGGLYILLVIALLPATARIVSAHRSLPG
jgi:hypothetical protein